ASFHSPSLPPRRRSPLRTTRPLRRPAGLPFLGGVEVDRELEAPACPATAASRVSFGNRDLLLVEGDIAAVVLADAVEGLRVRVWVTPRCVVMGGTIHGDVVILGDALPRAGIRGRAVTERTGADRGGAEVVVARDADQVRLRSIRHNRVIDDGLHGPFPSGCRKIPLRQLRTGRVTSRPAAGPGRSCARAGESAGERPRYDLRCVDDNETSTGRCWTGMVRCQPGVAGCCRFRHAPGACTASGREAPVLP